MSTLEIKMQKASRGGYVVYQDGELVAACSTLAEAYEFAGQSLREEFKESPFYRPQRLTEEKAEPAVRVKPIAEPVAAPKSPTTEYLKQQLNGMTATAGAFALMFLVGISNNWSFGA